jgi:tRNA(Ile)-lysidine synthase
LLAEFEHFINQHQLINKGEKVLLAISGGIDSMVMLHLFMQSSIPFEVAHCNFMLRQAESEGDEAFIDSFCKQHEIKLHIEHFDTLVYAHENTISIQMAARALRYNWFDSVCQENGIQLIATAHHQNDVAETMLINIVRGTGIAGIHGILPKQKNIIRPLLFANKIDITHFAKLNKINYRTDSSNEKDTYWRNKIRHHVLPVFNELNPNNIDSFYRLSQKIQASELLIQERLQELKQEYTYTKGDKLYIDKKVSHHFSAKVILFDMISPFGFHEEHIDKILSNRELTTGNSFLSHTHEMLFVEDYFIIAPLKNNLFKKQLVITHEEQSITSNNYQFDIKLSNKVPTVFSKDYFYLDADVTGSSFTMRSIQTGDKFTPLGLKGKKLISDYLTDKKIDKFDKKSCLVLLSTKTNDIVCLLPFQIGDTYKISPSTKSVIAIKYSSI